MEKKKICNLTRILYLDSVLYLVFLIFCMCKNGATCD